MATTIRRPRVATPQRWQKALSRAIDGQVQVRQLAGCGAWIATSASDPSTAYELEITGEVAHGCSCLAGLNSDPVCCHRAMFYHQLGHLDPEPEPPAPAICRACQGCGLIYDRDLERAGLLYPSCQPCHGTGKVVTPLAA
ncbi:MAG: hypothetical protein M3464_15615 [Chloroflexota bacterium]|nr:hypothetical protein [Chloroflexota bacterium]